MGRFEPNASLKTNTFTLATKRNSWQNPLNIGMIGYGFMGRAHSNGYRRVSNFFDLEYTPVLKAACGRDEGAVKKFADMWGYESTETDWRTLIQRDDIDAVDICVPNNLHREIALAAAEAGKMILCEKPLAMNSDEGEAMCQAVEAAGVHQHGVVQLPANPGGYACQEHHRRRKSRTRLSLPSQLSAGLDDRVGSAPRRRGTLAGLMPTPPEVALPAICWLTVSTRQFG